MSFKNEILFTKCGTGNIFYFMKFLFFVNKNNFFILSVNNKILITRLDL